MAINDNRTYLPTSDFRRAHRSGANYGRVVRDNNARLDVGFTPDESGLYGCGQSLLPFAASLMISGTVYFEYIGKMTGNKRFTSVNLVSTVVGSGTISGVGGFATTASAPGFTDKTDLTVQATGTLDTVSAIGRRNAIAFLTDGVTRYNPAAGIHVWAFVLTTNSVSQATVWGFTGDMGAGAIQVATGQTVAACVVGKTYTTAARPSPSTAAFQAPQLFVL